MSDEIDKTQQDMDFLVGIFKPNLKKEAEATGECLFCGEKIEEPGRRWCSFECAQLWEKEQFMNKWKKK